MFCQHVVVVVVVVVRTAVFDGVSGGWLGAGTRKIHGFIVGTVFVRFAVVVAPSIGFLFLFGVQTTTRMMIAASP